MRELIRIGKPAVPKLVEELDRIESDKRLRALGSCSVESAIRGRCRFLRRGSAPGTA